MKLILSSCDFGNPHSAKFIKDNLDKPISKCKVLYFPNEKVTLERIETGMYESRVAAFGFQKDNIYVANYFNPTPFFNLDIDVIYISGGNTFGTIKMIRDTGFDKIIVEYVRRGAIYIGGSAGAHIATANLTHVQKYDKDTFGITDFSGLGLYNGILICHYTETRKEDFESLINVGEYQVTALTNDDSIIVKD